MDTQTSWSTTDSYLSSNDPPICACGTEMVAQNDDCVFYCPDCGAERNVSQDDLPDNDNQASG